ncbi:MAG: hypothetical protein NDP13_04855 [Crenarchaeota archaeon]|nr:hypothetical protein [Thermoproteota archaeon]MCR8454297.1 hypothetical protein [Thermoproteota archaeon]MCR8455065.1 hypothetical protein [Thermoproteota archaeon]MCR8463358.1 hypothetical protein [Thermoproteota archaeon]MCR8470805.1 hypothetical protein [Thermoproteota archaeon]
MPLEYTWTYVQVFKMPIISEKYRTIWEKIRTDTIRLDQLFAVHRGLWTGVPYLYVVQQSLVDEYSLEKEPLKPIIRGRDIRPFGFTWKGFYIIYASEKHFPDLPNKYVNIMKWLESGKLVLERRAAVFTWNKKWWELEDPLDPKVFEQKKIISPLFSRQQSFAIDEQGLYYVLDSTILLRKWLSYEEQKMYAENWKKVNEATLNVENFIEAGREARKILGNDDDALWYTLGILNSETLEFFFKQYSPRLMKRTKRPKKGRWYSYMPPYVNILPVKVAEENTRKEVIKYSKEISEKTRTYLSIQQESERPERKELESEIGFLMHELNEIVFDIYELKEEERIVIQNYVYKKR